MQTNRIFLGLMLVLVSACSGQKVQQKESQSVKPLPYYQEATFTPNWIEKSSKELETFHTIPDFELTNQNGEVVNRESLEGKIHVADFFFSTCPGICPKMTSNMQIVQEAFSGDRQVQIISYSVTPDIDTPEVLAEYADRNEINAEDWMLLTGDRETIYQLGRKAYFVEEDLGLEKTDDEFLHTENFVLVDENGHIRGIYNGLNKISVAELIDDIKTLKKEFNSDSRPS